MPRGGIATYIGRRADLYRSTRRSILVDEATYIGSPSDQYSFAPPSSMGTVNTFQRKQRSLPTEEAQGGYNAIARPQEPWAQEGGRYYTNLTYRIEGTPLEYHT